MSTAQLDRHGHRLIQLGVLLFLLTCLEGLVIPNFRVPLLGRSVHTLTGLSGVILMAFGLTWTRLQLSRVAEVIAFWTLIYSTLATIMIFVFAGLWGAGATVIPLAARGARGTDSQETILKAIAISAGPTAIVAFALILWGLRGPPPRKD
jgi:hydroxylaminobenzene mutase